jgi:uncharacterized protein YjgD (DUF1641 family)
MDATGTDSLTPLARIEHRLAHLDDVVQRLEQTMRSLPVAMAAAVDTVDDVVDGLRDRGIDVDTRLGAVLEVVERLTRPDALSAIAALLERVDTLRSLMESGMLDPATVRMVGQLGRALAVVDAGPAERVGAFGALRAMSNANVQRSMGFALALARTFGAELSGATNAIEGGRTP